VLGVEPRGRRVCMAIGSSRNRGREHMVSLSSGRYPYAVLYDSSYREASTCISAKVSEINAELCGYGASSIACHARRATQKRPRLQRLEIWPVYQSSTACFKGRSKALQIVEAASED